MRLGKALQRQRISTISASDIDRLDPAEGE
jgi:hypothetical protein